LSPVLSRSISGATISAYIVAVVATGGAERSTDGVSTFKTIGTAEFVTSLCPPLAVQSRWNADDVVGAPERTGDDLAYSETHERVGRRRGTGVHSGVVLVWLLGHPVSEQERGESVGLASGVAARLRIVEHGLHVINRVMPERRR
jgi:hypothetical protein